MFCVNHLDPRLAFFSARFKLHEMVKDEKYRLMLMKELKRPDGHPCLPYTRKRIEELQIERKMMMDLFDRLLDRRYCPPTIKEEPRLKGKNVLNAVDP